MADDAVNNIKNGTLKLLHDLWIWDTGEKQRMMREATAQGFGLAGSDYNRPFPGSTTNVTVTAPPPAAPAVAAPAVQAAATAGSTLAKVLGAGVLGAAASGAGLWALLPRAAQTPPATPPAAEKKVDPVELDVQWKLGPDGKWQATVAPVAPVKETP